jgi:hypothetical protein
VTSQIAFDFEPPAQLCARKAARARDAVARYRSLTSDDDITGRETDIMKLLRRRPMQEPARHVASERAPRSSPGLPPARFHMPRPPVGRPRTADGQQSFHFELTTVTKGVDGACRTNDGRAADPVGHVGYVGREEAVAVDAPTEVHEAIAHVGYVARDPAVALDGKGAAIIETNIEGDPADFFATVLEHEDRGHPDGICLVDPIDRVRLQTLMQEATIPPRLKAGIDAILTNPETHRVHKSGSPKSKTHPFQVDADISGSGAWLRKHDQSGLIHLRKGRGGIVQRRITGELPAEFGPERCRRVLKTLAAEFERRGLRYYVALHAPTAANNDRNWHFHLLYYDRPCDRIDGEWDFAIVKEKRTSSRNLTRSYPHRQKKCPEVAHRSWPMEIRERFAVAVNVELEAIGSPRRYDPRSYLAMGIEAEPQDHLARRPAFLAACGGAPARDVENARKGWSARLMQLLKRHDQIEKDDEARVADLRITVGETPKKRASLADLERELAERRAEARTADVLVRILHPMARSNAEQTAKTMRGHATDLANKQRAAGKEPADHRRHEEFKQREREAHAYLGELEQTLAPDVKFAHRLMAEAQIARERIETEFQILHDQAVWTCAHAVNAVAMTVTSPMQEAAVQNRTVDDATPPPIVTAEPAPSPSLSVKIPSDAETRSSAEVDDWLARIKSNRRRIVRRDDRTEPFKINDLDRRMLHLASPEQLKELDRVRDRQNRLIRRIVAAVEATPGILTIPDDPNGKWTLAHRDGDLQDGLRRYIVDPSVQNQLRTARETGLAHQATTRQAAPQVHRAIDEISRAGIAVQRQEYGLAVRAADAARLGISADDLKQPAAERRLDEIRQTQDKRRALIAPPNMTASPHVDDRSLRDLETRAPAVPPAAPTPLNVADLLRPVPANASSAIEPAVATHPLILSWREAHHANLRPGSAITVAERNRRAAVALNDKVAADELGRLGPAILALATAQAAENQRHLQRTASRSTQHPVIR